MTEFRRRREEIAARFLQTVVIVDDEAYIGDPPGIAGHLDTPTRRTAIPVAAEEAEEVAERGEGGSHNLNAGLLVESFSRRGLICAVIAPQSDAGRSDTDPTDLVAPAARRADIVILDWRLNNDNGEKTMSILKNILATDNEMDPDGRLRLVAVYTGEQNLSGIGRKILDGLDGFDGDERCVVLSRRHCRILIYAKSDTPLVPDLVGRSFSESDMPERLIRDFTRMTEGLLPSIALTSLAAIRENSHRILDRLDANLDPAFLTHRACLSVPDDSQQHMVAQRANELHGIMGDAVASGNPAGMEAIEGWLNSSLGPDAVLNFGDGKRASREETIAMLKEGLEEKTPNDLNRRSGFRFLTRGFSNGEDSEHQLDRRLAWMFNFRTVFGPAPPILQLGTVLRRENDDADCLLLCMRPICDSVRLPGTTNFLLLPLVAPDGKPSQFVLRTDVNTFRRVAISTKMNQWLLIPFFPNQATKSVAAERDGADFCFSDVDGIRFDWMGELKADFAQRIAHEFASSLSRVAVNDSEWLRRESTR